MRKAYMAWCPRYRIGHPRAGEIVVGTEAKISALVRQTGNDRFPFWGAVCGSSSGIPSAAADARVQVFSNFAALVVRDGIDPVVAHAAFLAIDEYREVMGAMQPDSGEAPGPVPLSPD